MTQESALSVENIGPDGGSQEHLATGYMPEIVMIESGGRLSPPVAEICERYVLKMTPELRTAMTTTHFDSIEKFWNDNYLARALENDPAVQALRRDCAKAAEDGDLDIIRQAVKDFRKSNAHLLSPDEDLQAMPWQKKGRGLEERILVSTALKVALGFSTEPRLNGQLNAEFLSYKNGVVAALVAFAPFHQKDRLNMARDFTPVMTLIDDLAQMVGKKRFIIMVPRSKKEREQGLPPRKDADAVSKLYYLACRFGMRPAAEAYIEAGANVKAGNQLNVRAGLPCHTRSRA